VDMSFPESRLRAAGHVDGCMIKCSGWF